MKIKIYAVFLLSALVIIMSAMPVYGAGGENSESMVVNASWLDGDMLRIDVLDAATGGISSLAVRLSDLVEDAGSSPYIVIQAVDLDGNQSGVIRIDNPMYIPAETNSLELGEVTTIPQRGLTPDGTGTVVDNVITEGDLEFFTVFTEAGNVFFLVIDRQRGADNVYLLNAVTEADLMALAERDGNPIDNSTVSAIPTPPLPEPPTMEQPPIPQPEPQPEPPSTGNNNGSIIFIVVAVVVVCAAAYYFKIGKGKKSAPAPDDFDESEDDWDYESDDYLDDDAIDEGDGRSDDEE